MLLWQWFSNFFDNAGSFICSPAYPSNYNTDCQFFNHAVLIFHTPSYPTQFYAIQFYSTQLHSILYNSIQSYSTPPESTQFYPILPNSAQFCPILSNSTQFYPILSNSTQFYPILSNSTQLYPILSNSIQFYPTLSNSIQFYPTQFHLILYPIVGLLLIVNSRFLERPQKRNRGNQLIHRRLSKAKSKGSGQDPCREPGNHPFQTNVIQFCLVRNFLYCFIPFQDAHRIGRRVNRSFGLFLCFYSAVAFVRASYWEGVILGWGDAWQNGDVGVARGM